MLHSSIKERLNHKIKSQAELNIIFAIIIFAIVVILMIALVKPMFRESQAIVKPIVQKAAPTK